MNKKLLFSMMTLAVMLFVGACNSSTDKQQSANDEGVQNAPNQVLDGEQIFDNHCKVCHIKGLPSKATMSSMSAPPITGVAFHLKQHFTRDSVFNREEAVAFVVDYVQYPDKLKALCMPKTLKRFGSMPSLKGSLTEEQLQAVAGYIVDNYPLKNFKHPEGEPEEAETK